MDIAKIRKKIKEEEQKSGGQSMTHGKKEDIAPKQEDRAADDMTAGAQQPPVTSEKTEDSKQQIEKPSAISHQPSAKPQPEAAAQVVSESENRTESVSKPVPEGLNQGAAKPVVDSTLREEAISGIIELLTFQLAAEEFAFRISEVEEILTPQQITMVPKAPDYILGITAVRGKVMPVLDLKKRLSIKDNGASASGGGKVRKKILTLKGPKGRIGIMIDRINGVIRIDESDIAEPPAHLSESDLMFVGGVVLYNGRFISVIRLEEAANINLK